MNQENTMKLAIPALFLAITAALMSASISARPGWPGGPGHDGALDFLDRVADEIGLTVEQESEINELINGAKLASAVDRERMDQIREELRRLSLSDESFDSSAASVLTGELAETVARTALAAAETRWKLRQILTPEQRQQLDEWRAGRGQPHARFHGIEPLGQ
jgi:Spy/CpxP family protein refolding chaperone